MTRGKPLRQALRMAERLEGQARVCELLRLPAIPEQGADRLLGVAERV